MGQATAQMNVSDLRKALGMPGDELSPESQQLVNTFCQPSPGPALRRYRVRRQSMEQLDLIKVAWLLCCLLYIYAFKGRNPFIFTFCWMIMSSLVRQHSGILPLRDFFVFLRCEFLSFAVPCLLCASYTAVFLFFFFFL